jgi:hypothetical protein
VPTILPMSTNFLNINPSNQHQSGNLFVTGIASTTDVDKENKDGPV